MILVQKPDSIMQQDSFLSFDLPAIARNKVSIGFDGGVLSSDGGGLLLADVCDCGGLRGQQRLHDAAT
jgi:hypothetical protein